MQKKQRINLCHKNIHKKKKKLYVYAIKKKKKKKKKKKTLELNPTSRGKSLITRLHTVTVANHATFV